MYYNWSKIKLGYDSILVKQQKWALHRFNYHLNYHCSRSRHTHRFSTKPSSTRLPHTASKRHCGCGGSCCLPVWGSIRFSKCHIHHLREWWQLQPHLPLRTCGRYSPGKVVPSAFSIESKILNHSKLLNITSTMDERHQTQRGVLLYVIMSIPRRNYIYDMHQL